MPGHLFAITSTSEEDRVVRRIPTTGEVQQEIEGLFVQQADAYSSEIKLVTFNPRDRIEKGEAFIIRGYKLPNNVLRSPAFPQENELLNVASEMGIKSIFMARVSGPEKEFYFQAFSPGRQSLARKTTLFLSGAVFQKLEPVGLVLNDHLDAVHINSNLIFRNFSTVNRFLDLSDYFNAASDKDMKQILSHELFHVSNQQAILDVADTIVRKKMMIIKLDGSLDEIKTSQVKRTGKKYGVAVSTKGGKVVFPETRKEVKDLLHVLMDAFYEGELTGRKYLATAQRPVSAS